MRTLISLPFLLLAFLCGCPADGGGDDACTPAIPADAEPVTDSTNAVNSGGVYWVCDGGTLNISTGDAEVYVESGGTVNLTGGEVALWAADGATVAVVTGEGELVLDSGATVSGVGDSLSVTDCSELVFDTADAPAGGCD